MSPGKLFTLTVCELGKGTLPLTLFNLTWRPRAGCMCETLLTSKKMKMIWVQEFKAEEGEDHFNREGAAVHKVAIKYLSC